MRSINVLLSLATQGWMCPHVKCDFWWTGTILARLEPVLAGWTSSTCSSEPRLLLQLWTDNSICSISLSAVTLLVAWQEGYPACLKTACWFVGGDSWLELCTSYSSSCHQLTTSVILSPNKIQNWDVRVPANPSPPGKMTNKNGEIITLHAKLSGAVYCNRSCLWVCGCVFVGLLPQ